MSTKIAAQDYIDQGWAVVPVPRGSKGNEKHGTPRKGWNTDTFTAGQFEDDENVAGLLGEKSGDIIVFDGDDHITVRAMELLLPDDTRIDGRSGNSKSHWFCRRLGITYRPFKIGEDKFLEILGTGRYVMLPPSWLCDDAAGMPGGDTYETNGKPVKDLTADEVELYAKDLAVTVVRSRGFAFAQRDDHGPDAFIHASELKNLAFESLCEGHRVSFDFIPGKQGGRNDRAINVTVLPGLLEHLWRPDPNVT